MCGVQYNNNSNINFPIFQNYNSQFNIIIIPNNINFPIFQNYNSQFNIIIIPTSFQLLLNKILKNHIMYGSKLKEQYTNFPIFQNYNS